MLKVSIGFVETLEISIVFLGCFNELFKRYVASTVAVKGIKELINLLRWYFKEMFENSIERFALETTGITVKLWE